MSEQEQAPVEGTPENAAPVEETAGNETEAQSVDFEKRYNDMRSEFDRRGSRVAELERYEQAVTDLRSEDSDTRSRAAQMLGIEFADDTPEDEYQDPSEALAREVAAIKEQLASRDQESQQAQQIAQIEQHVEQKLAALEDLDDSDRKWIVNTAVALPPTAEGMPDIQAAYDEFKAWETARQQKWAKSKRAPHIGQVGTAGTQALPEDADHNARVEWALERLAADQ